MNRFRTCSHFEGHASGFLSSDIFGESLLEVWLEPSNKTLISINQKELEDMEEKQSQKALV